MAEDHMIFGQEASCQLIRKKQNTDNLDTENQEIDNKLVSQLLVDSSGVVSITRSPLDADARTS